jgi:hypothetical protein
VGNHVPDKCACIPSPSKVWMNEQPGNEAAVMPAKANHATSIFGHDDL